MRFLGSMNDEERLAFEQESGIKTDAAIRIVEEAKAEAARVKAEQEAQMATEAEPARLKAEQEAQAAAEEKAMVAVNAGLLGIYVFGLMLRV